MYPFETNNDIISAEIFSTLFEKVIANFCEFFFVNYIIVWLLIHFIKWKKGKWEQFYFQYHDILVKIVVIKRIQWFTKVLNFLKHVDLYSI